MLGRVIALATYPVKSMAGIPAQSAELGFHGFAGDRRFAFRRKNDATGMPFLTASRFPELVTYQPNGIEPTHVRTPDGSNLELRSEELRAAIERKSGHAVELLMFKNGIFDDGLVSVITSATLAAIGRETGMELDPRRMRANIVLETESGDAFQEDAWLGRTMVFGDGDAAPALSVNARDERCAMVNIDPDSGRQDARVMKAVVRMNENCAGVYASAIRTGTITVGQPVILR